MHESRFETLFKELNSTKDISIQPSTIKSAHDPSFTLATVSELEIAKLISS